MVKLSEPELDAVFSALADPTRRALMARLAAGEASVSELAAPLPMSLPAVTKHLGVLERAGLVAGEKRGRVRHCRLLAEPLRDAGDWIARYAEFWSGRLEGLAEHLRAREGSP